MSYLGPVTLQRSRSEVSGSLELVLYQNQCVLITSGALYSDGDRYAPALAVVRHLEDFLPGARSVLLLGVGLGSLVQVMRRRGYDPRYTLVEKDPVVLAWAMQLLAEPASSKLVPLCQDAEAFMAESQRSYDFVFVDIFTGREVPAFVTMPTFLRQCRDSLAPGGRLALNYIERSGYEWDRARATLDEVFPAHHLIRSDDNRILISAPAGSTTAPPPER